ncbi:hypothetical protein [Nocardioides yefusunii]|uniref:Ig-like domain-containing protein n=1 Tax=Nocardioides yefusunii TaxID=2500546 RepID=A0ABW1R0F2_9ACTN|nr:hypothetical protein [Nocardioides yefusunii]
MPVSRSTRPAVASVAGLLAISLGAALPASAIDSHPGPGVGASWTITPQGIELTPAGPRTARIEYRTVLAGGATAGWNTYAGPLKPHAHDVPGHQEFRALDGEGRATEPAQVPGEQQVSFGVAIGRAVHGRPMQVTVRAQRPFVGPWIPMTGVVRVGGKTYRTELVRGVGSVKVPTTKAGRVAVTAHVEDDHVVTYSLVQTYRPLVAKATTTTTASVSKGRTVKVRVAASGTVHLGGKARVVVKREGRTVARLHARVSARGIATVTLPHQVRAGSGPVTVKARYLGTANLKPSTSRALRVRR